MKTLTAILAIALLASSAVADECATVPYSALLKAAKIDVSDIEGIRISSRTFSVRSTLSNVMPTDIKLNLTVGDRTTPLEISADGTFDLPISKFLAAFSAKLTTDQPSKTVAFGVLLSWDRDVELDRTDDGARVRYASLFPSPKAIRRVLAVVDELKGDERLNDVIVKPYPTVRSVFFEIEDPKLSTAIVIDFGETKLEVAPITKGKYKIDYRPEWMQLNPWIQMSPAEPWGLDYESSSTAADKAAPCDATEPGS